MKERTLRPMLERLRRDWDDHFKEGLPVELFWSEISGALGRAFEEGYQEGQNDAFGDVEDLVRGRKR